MTERETPPNFHPAGFDSSAPAPRFAMAKRVRIGAAAPVALQGLNGVVERVVGHFAAAPGAAKSPLYRVRVALIDLWGAGAGGFEPEDTLDLELFESALSPFFDYADFEAEKARLETQLGGAMEVDEAERLEALAGLCGEAEEEAQVDLTQADGVLDVVIEPSVSPNVLRAALRSPRRDLSQFGVVAAPDRLRLHLASGRIAYRIYGA